jgi:nitrile hydratase
MPPDRSENDDGDPSHDGASRGETDHSHDHPHDHGHDHAEASEVDPEDPEARARALQSLLIEKGLVSTEAIDRIVTAYEQEIGPMYGARVVARAWTDDGFRERLLADGQAAIEELEFDHGTDDIRFVENTDSVHNVVVCTLCSCYPWSVLGLPPTWYKSEAYRARVVREPREVLAEFGLDLDDDVEVRVWDSSSDLRYAVLPRRPPGTDDATESELAGVVTRNAMIGVERVPTP